MQRYTEHTAHDIEAARRKVPQQLDAMVRDDRRGMTVRSFKPRKRPQLHLPERVIELLLKHAPFLSRIADWTHVAVAGGSVARALFPRGFEYHKNAPDTDLFLHGIRDGDHLEGVVRTLCSQLRPSWAMRTTGLITLGIDREHGPGGCAQCQIVLLEAERVEDVVETFDVDEACVAFDGRDVWVHPRALEAFVKCTSTLRPGMSSGDPFKRLIKYAEFTEHNIFVPIGCVGDVDPTSIFRCQREEPILSHGDHILYSFPSLGGGLCIGSHRVNQWSCLQRSCYSPPPSNAIVIAKDHLFALVGVIAIVRRRRTEREGNDVSFTWDPSTRVGGMIERATSAPEKYVWTPLWYDQVNSQGLRRGVPEELIDASIRGDRERFAHVIREDVRRPLLAMKDAFWTIPLTLSPREQLFG